MDLAFLGFFFNFVRSVLELVSRCFGSGKSESRVQFLDFEGFFERVGSDLRSYEVRCGFRGSLRRYCDLVRFSFSEEDLFVDSNDG